MRQKFSFCFVGRQRLLLCLGKPDILLFCLLDPLFRVCLVLFGKTVNVHGCHQDAKYRHAVLSCGIDMRTVDQRVEYHIGNAAA